MQIGSTLFPFRAYLFPFGAYLFSSHASDFRLPRCALRYNLLLFSRASENAPLLFHLFGMRRADFEPSLETSERR